jgi:hypothetical protein
MLCRAEGRFASAGAAVIAMTLACISAGLAFESRYTSIAEAQCRKFDVVKIANTEYGASRVCAGRGGYKVFIHEQDLRETLTVGRTIKQASKEPAAHDHYGAFNHYEDTIEWRSGKDGLPYALIAGWSFADNENVDPTGRPNRPGCWWYSAYHPDRCARSPISTAPPTATLTHWRGRPPTRSRATSNPPPTRCR